MQQLPGDLERRFRRSSVLRPWDPMKGGIWLVHEACDRVAPPLVLKLSIPSESPERRVLEQLGGGHPHWAVPKEFGDAEGWFYQVGEYFPMSGLNAQLLEYPNGLSPAWRLLLLRQTAAALTALHALSIVHCDLKPSNILVRPATGSGWHYLIGDFDAAVLLDNGGGRLTRRYTPRYAAPELLGGGTLTSAVDYWSLGMVLLECLLGHHPLEKLDERGIRTVLTTGWQPDFSRIEDTFWRALLGGLLARNPGQRWGADQVARALAGDLATLSEGLLLVGESACAVPFHVAGIPVFSTEGLARAILRQWEVIR